MTEYLDIATAAKRLGNTERHIRRMCAAGKLPGAVKSGGRWSSIPATSHPKLIRTNSPEEITAELDLAGISKTKKEQAFKRVGLVKKCEQFCCQWVRAGKTRSEAIACFCKTEKISRSRMYHCLTAYKKEGLLGLVDSRGGGRKLADIISPDAWEFFKSMYLDQRQLTLKQCYDMTSIENQLRKRGWTMPPLRTMYRYVEKQIPLFVSVLHREGMQAYEARCAPYIVRDPDSVAPGAVWIGDHHQCNCWVRHHGKWIRPWLTAWEDMRSRAITGYHICPSPNQMTILLAAKRGIEKYGPPDSVKIDNGRDYDSEMWTGTTKARRKAIKKGQIDELMVAGLYAMMDVTVSFAIPYHPQSKPIERFFDTFDCQFVKTMPTYCGKDTARKPDYLNDLLGSDRAMREAKDLVEFEQLVGAYIERYNSTAHGGAGMNGQSPMQVLQSRESRRVLADGVLELLARGWSGELTVGKNGVKYRSMWYGQYDMDLLAHQGRKVRIAYDPDDLSRVHVYDANTMKLIVIAEQAQLIGYGDKVSEELLRDAMKRKARAVKAANAFRDTRRTANMDLPTLALEALEAGKVASRMKPPATNIRPVRTPFDGETREHKKQEALKAVRRAAGLESQTTVLGIDLSVLIPPKRQSVKLFND